MTHIAIIGAGLSGLTTANMLKQHAKVTVFEKSLGAGGRMATRHAGDFNFDHGAQFFKATQPEFQAFTQKLLTQGIIKRWDARFVELARQKITSARVWDKTNPHYVGTPGMSTIGKHLAQGLEIRYGVRAAKLNRRNGWEILDEQGATLGQYDWVISAVPAAQAVTILPESFRYYSKLTAVKMLGCFSLMLGFEEPIPLEFDAAVVKDADISWISVNSVKPDRSGKFCILAHSSNEWAEAHIEDDKAQIMEYLCHELSTVIGFTVNSAIHKDLQRWRYANIEKQGLKQVLLDEKLQLAACGDWAIQGRVEAAFKSGFEVASRILAMIKG